MSHSTFSHSQLHPILLSDWLPKLGEKAFLAWFHFHSWKFEKNPLNDSLLIPLSLNKVIKRLKTGKATFYNQILRPLVKFGLVCLQHASHSKQEMNLIVHSFPPLPPEHTESSITMNQPISESSFNMKSETDGLSSDSSITKQPDDSKEQNERQSHYPESTILEDTPTYHVSQETENHSQQPLNVQPKRKPKSFQPLRLPSDSGTNLHPTFDSLPPLIQQTINADQRLLDRSTEIIHAYHQCHQHPGYDELKFNKKMLTCMEYPYVKKENFGAYLLKALLNEWNAKPSVSSPPPAHIPTTSSTRSHDVPEWIVRQQEREKLGIREPSTELDPEQKAEAERLLRELGEWPV